MPVSKYSRSLSERLVRINQSSILLALAIVMVLFIFAGAITGLIKLLDDSHSKANFFAQNIIAPLVASDKDTATELLSVLVNEVDVLSVAIYDRHGEQFASSSRINHYAPDRFDLLRPGVDYGFLRFTLVRPLIYDRQLYGSFLLTIDMKPLYMQIGWVSMITIFAAMFALLYTRRFSVRLSSQVVQPIDDLSQLMERITHHNEFNLRADPSDIKEFQKLADGFNAMLEEIVDRDNRLSEHRDHLEDMVKERTSQMTEAKNEAERANKTKSEFLSSMSHELRTPMNAILGFAQLLEYDDALSLDQRENIDEILKAGRHLLVLINEVLDLAKVESGKVELSMEPVELGPMIADCVSLVQPQADKNAITLNVNVEEHVFVRADLTRLKQSAINLLSNAIKYNRKAGRVDVSVELQDDNKYRIYVKDTGQGIPKEKQVKLFEPFNRLGAEGGTIEGTGIGLTITRRIVELMGGTVDVESEVGQGSCFWIELPRVEVELSQASISDEQIAHFYSEVDGGIIGESTILYIEDNPANLRLVERIISGVDNLKLITANEPELGINLAISTEPSLILLDINLPGMSGYDVLKFLRKQPAFQNTPILALTANAMPRDIERGLKSGFDDYLTKPIQVSVFLERIHHWLAKGHQNPKDS